MIPISTEMRNAIRAGAKQRALLYFVNQGLYFTVNDIVLGSWKYTGSFNPDTDLTFGRAISASLIYTLVNGDGALNAFTFGEFNAYMGVKMGEFPYFANGAITVVDFQGNRYAGHQTAPYLTKNGEAFSTQPNVPVEALIAIDDTLYCLTSTRTVLAIRQTNATKWQDLSNKTWLSQANYTWDSYDGQYSVWTTTITDETMWALCQRYIRDNTGIAITDNSKSLVFKDGTAEEYQYTQIGHFYADRPSRVRTNAVKVQAYDAMEAKLNALTSGLTTPTTLQGLLNQVVQKTGVTSKAGTLLNSALPVPAMDFSEMTYREVLALIAQASCTYARFDYDGKLDLRWFGEINVSLDEHDYTEFVPYEYTVKKVDKLQVRSTESDVGIVVGSGTNGYIIQNHPFFIFASDAAGRTYCQNIYNRISAFAQYTPGNVKWFTDFSVQPGDIITVKSKGVSYRFPIFMQDYTWTGICKGSSECTGNEYREVLKAVNRKEWREQVSQTRRYSEISTSIDGLRVKTGVDNLATGETLYSQISASADAITAEVTRATQAEGSLSSRITASADSFQATFKKIGASGYTATGITTITENGITVTHSSLSNCYTQMSANGFRILSSNGTVLGGVMSLNNKVVTAMNALYNTSFPAFVMDVGSYTPYDTEGTTSGYGISLKDNGTEFMHIGKNVYQSGYAQANELYSTQGLMFVVNGSFGLQRRSGASITFRSDYDLQFNVRVNGVVRQVKVSDLYNLLN